MRRSDLNRSRRFPSCPRRRFAMGLLPAGSTFERRSRSPSRVVGDAQDVEGPDPLVVAILAAVRARLTSVHPESARAFQRLLGRATTKPGRTWRELGRLLFDDDEFEAAGRAFGYAAAYEPDDAGLQATLALTCLRLDDVPAFEGYLQRAFTLEPTNQVALELLANLTRDHGDPKVAAGIYVRLMKVGGRDSGRYFADFGRCLMQSASQATLIHWMRGS